MHHDVQQFIRYLVALSGGDPCQTQIPRGKHRLRIHTQRIGETRLVTVVPERGPLPDSETTALAHLVAAPGTVLLRGIIAAAPLPPPPAETAPQTLWLTLPGAGALPLVAPEKTMQRTLEGLVKRAVIVRGACAEQGIVVHAVQAEAQPGTRRAQ